MTPLRYARGWQPAPGYLLQERDLPQQIGKVVLKGAVDLVVFRIMSLHLVVAGETQEAIDSVRTSFKAGRPGEACKLVVEREPGCVSVAFGPGGSVSVQMAGRGSVSIVSSSGSIQIGGLGRGGAPQGRAVVGLALPIAPTVSAKGEGAVTLTDLDQDCFVAMLSGTGSITASGRVEHLDVDLSGAGAVQVRDLAAGHVQLRLGGAGKIEAFARLAVDAELRGAGVIDVWGRPAQQRRRITGPGQIRIR